MSQMTLDIPAQSLLSLKLSESAAAAEIRLVAAVRLYELGRLSSGLAARLAGIRRVLFLSKLAKYGVYTFRLGVNELQRRKARLAMSHAAHSAGDHSAKRMIRPMSLALER